MLKEKQISGLTWKNWNVLDQIFTGRISKQSPDSVRVYTVCQTLFLSASTVFYMLLENEMFKTSCSIRHIVDITIHLL